MLSLGISAEIETCLTSKHKQTFKIEPTYNLANRINFLRNSTIIIQVNKLQHKNMCTSLYIQFFITVITYKISYKRSYYMYFGDRP